MSPAVEEILQEALELPEDARIDLPTALLASLAGEPGEPAAWRQVAKRRLDVIRSGDRETIRWDAARRPIFASPAGADR